MIGCWPDSNTPEPSALWAKAVLQRGEIKGAAGSPAHLHLHDGPGIGAVAGQGGRGADRGKIRAAGIVVIARQPWPGRRRGIVVKDKGLTGELREVDDDVEPLGGSDQQRVLVDIADVKDGRVDDPGGRLGRNHHRGRQEAALGTDDDPVGAGRAEAVVSGVGKMFGSSWAAASSVGLRATSVGSDLPDRSLLSRIGHIPLQVEEPVVGRIEDAQTIGLGLQGDCRIGRAVDNGRVVELLHARRRYSACRGSTSAHRTGRYHTARWLDC